MLATKLRALLQRDKGRDLYDLAHALEIFPGLDKERTVEMFGQYLAATDLEITRAQAEERMLAKLILSSGLHGVQKNLTTDSLILQFLEPPASKNG